MKKINLILLSILSILTLISCQKISSKKEVTSNYPTIETIIQNYQALTTTKLTGTFCVQSLTINDQNNTNTAQIGGGFYDKDGSLKKGGKVNIGGIEIQPKNNFFGFDKYLERNNFFGKNVTFNIDDRNTVSVPKYEVSPNLPAPVGEGGSGTGGSGGTGGGGNGGGGTTVYIPQAIIATATRVGTSIPTYHSYNIAWNADALNTNGVVIVAEYSHDLFDNTGIPTVTPVRKSILVGDNGFTTLAYAWFNSFPRNSTIVLYVGRGNYTLVNEGGILIGGYTANAIFSIKIPSIIPVGPPSHS